MATMREVAQRAGVSVTTVSHVINETRLVSEELRLRVVEAIEKLNYRPNGLARSLRRGRTHTIGMLIPNSVNSYFAEVAQGVEETSFGQDYSVIVCNSRGDRDKGKIYIDMLIEKQVDGIIMVSVTCQPSDFELLQSHSIPLVVINRDIPGASVDSVAVDHRHGGSLATRHLIELGHRRIACIGGPVDRGPSLDRIHGYRCAMAEAGIPVDEALILGGDLQSEGGHTITSRLLSMREAPTAIVAGNDLMAMGGIRAAYEMGRRVPDDLSVIGYDDVTLARYAIPALTTISQPRYEIGSLATTLLIERMRNLDLPPRKRQLPVSLVVRESTAAPGEQAQAYRVDHATLQVCAFLGDQ